jgi:hypothetical protein
MLPGGFSNFLEPPEYFGSEAGPVPLGAEVEFDASLAPTNP